MSCPRMVVFKFCYVLNESYILFGGMDGFGLERVCLGFQVLAADPIPFVVMRKAICGNQR